MPQSKDNAPLRLNVGCGRNILPDWINLDGADLPGVDVCADLDSCAGMPLPLESNSIEEFRLSHVIEHLHYPLPLMQELHRIARPDAIMTIYTPHGASDDAWEDQTHVRPYFLNSFGYFSQPYYWRADYGYRGDWQTEEVLVIVDRATHMGMSAEDIMQRIQTSRNVVLEMIAKLRAVKPIRAPRRELIVNQNVRIELRDR